MNIRKVIDIYCQDNKVKKVIDIKKAKVLYDKMVEHNDQKSLCDGVKQKTVKELFDYFVFNNPDGVEYQVIDDETGEVQNVYENMDDCIENLQNLEVLTGDGETIQGADKKGNVDGERQGDTLTDEKVETKEKITEKTNE